MRWPASLPQPPSLRGVSQWCRWGHCQTLWADVRLPLQECLLLVGSLVASAFAPNIEVFILMRILTGLGGGALPPNAVGVVADVISPAKRAQAVGALLAVGMLTSAVSVPAVALLAGWGGWRLTFLLSGLLLAAGFVTNLIWFPRDRKERVRNFVFFSRYWSLLAMNFFRVALTVNVTQRIAYWGIVSFFAAFLINTYDVSLGFVALPLAITAIGQVIGSYASGFIATKKYRAVLVATTTAAGGVCGFLFFVLDLNIWVAVGLVAVGLAAMGSGLLSVTFPALVAASTEYSGDSKATGVGLMGLSNQSGGMFGAGLSGALLASTGYEGVGYLCLGLTVVSALLCTCSPSIFAWVEVDSLGKGELRPRHSKSKPGKLKPGRPNARLGYCYWTERLVKE